MTSTTDCDGPKKAFDAIFSSLMDTHRKTVKSTDEFMGNIEKCLRIARLNRDGPTKLTPSKSQLNEDIFKSLWQQQVACWWKWADGILQKTEELQEFKRLLESSVDADKQTQNTQSRE